MRGGRPWLLQARSAARLELDDLAAGLVERLALPAGAQPGVRRRYEELELGRLDPAAVDAGVWAALARLLGGGGGGASDAETPEREPAPALDALLEQGVALLRRSAAGAAPDEVDRLFGLSRAPRGGAGDLP